jgi:mannose-6-phosphate isomerase-like protein (cupin superfamily)
MAEALQLTKSESLAVVDSTPERLLVEATYGPGGKPPPKHLHPAQDERFEVIEGTLRFRLGSVESDLAAGAEIDIPRGVAHQVWNPHDHEAKVAWETVPGLRTEQWFRAVDRVVREAGEKDPSPLAFATLLSEYRDVFRLAIGPDPLVGPVIKALGAVGRLVHSRRDRS